MPDEVQATLLDGTKALKAIVWDTIPDEFTLSSGQVAIEGKVQDSSIYTYAYITVSETDDAVVIEPQISVNEQNANFSIAFSMGENSPSVLAVVAAYDEEGTMTKVKTKPLTDAAPKCSIELSDFGDEYLVKAFMLNNTNYVTDFVVIE